MVWLSQTQTAQIKTWFIKASPWLLLILAVLLLGFSFGYAAKGTEITRDCKYAGAFRVGVDSFTCSRRI